MARLSYAGVVATMLVVGAAGADARQTPAPAAAPQAAPQASRPSARTAQAGRPVSMTIAVTDESGTPLPGVSVAVTGPVTRSASSGDTGSVRLTGIRPGTYRIRFDKRGYVLLEREVVARGTPLDFEVTLSPAPEPEAAPEPAPAPEAAAEAPAPPGEPKAIPVADFIERNLIRDKEPLREDLLGCTASARTSLLQVWEPTREEAREDADEVLFVVAGEGTLRLGNRDVPLRASDGTTAIVPRGTARALSRKGRKVLIVLSVLSGEPCTTAAQ